MLELIETLKVEKAQISSLKSESDTLRVPFLFYFFYFILFFLLKKKRKKKNILLNHSFISNHFKLLKKN